MRQSRHLGLGGLHTYDTGLIDVPLNSTYRISGANFKYGSNENPRRTKVTRGGDMMNPTDGTIKGTGLFGFGKEKIDDAEYTFGNILAAPITLPEFFGYIVGIDFKVYATVINTSSSNYYWGLSLTETEYPSPDHPFMGLNDMSGLYGSAINGASGYRDNLQIAEGRFTAPNYTDVYYDWFECLATNGNNFFPKSEKTKRKNMQQNLIYLYLWDADNSVGNVHVGIDKSGPALQIKIYYQAYKEVNGWNAIDIPCRT